MTVDLSDNLVDALRKLAEAQGRPFDALIDDAVRDYIVSAAITDVTTEQVASTQWNLIPELADTADYEPGHSDESHATS